MRKQPVANQMIMPLCGWLRETAAATGVECCSSKSVLSFLLADTGKMLLSCLLLDAAKILPKQCTAMQIVRGFHIALLGSKTGGILECSGIKNPVPKQVRNGAASIMVDTRL